MNTKWEGVDVHNNPRHTKGRWVRTKRGKGARRGERRDKKRRKMRREKRKQEEVE